MRAIAPNLPRAAEGVIAENQLEYSALPIASVLRNGCQAVLTRWTMTPAERAAVAAGEDIYLTQLTFGHPLQPIAIQVGRAGIPEAEAAIGG